MKSILFFLRSTLTGGVLFLLPAVLLYILIGKGYSILLKLSEPLAGYLPAGIFGLDGSKILTVLILLLICFVAGLLFHSKIAKKGITRLEEKVLVFVPGYILLKSITADAIGVQVDNRMTPVLVQDGEAWNLAFLVEEGKELSTVFVPDAPRHDAGEVKLVPTQYIRKLQISNSQFTKSINTFGKGIQHFLPEEER